MELMMADMSLSLKILFWLFICLAVLFLLSKLPFVKSLLNKLLAKFLAWDNSRGAKLKNKNSAINQMKRKLFETMEQTINTVNGPVLEIGAGSGPNLEFYPSNTKLITVDLNEHFKQYLDANLKKYDHVTLEKYHTGNVENMKDIIEDNSCSCVVSSLILCCVNQEKALEEIYRVLKPGGKLYFIEHIIEKPGTFRRWIQKQIEPSWKALKFNCHLTKQTDLTLKNSNFKKLDASIVYRPTPSYFNMLFTRSYVGQCTKP